MTQPIALGRAAKAPPARVPASTPPPQAGDPLRIALLESRQRWRDLVALAADFAFEADADGRLVFITPDPVLGWTADALLGGSASDLLLNSGPGAFDPFRAEAPARDRRVWLRRADGDPACLSVSVVPLAEGGVRGVARDVTAQDARAAAAAGALRRVEVMDHILAQMRREVLAPRMMQATLSALRDALGADGICLLDPLGADDTPAVLHEAGTPAPALMTIVAAMLPGDEEPLQMRAPDRRPVLACTGQNRFGEQVALVIWRAPDQRDWDADDRSLAASVTVLMRVILDHDAIQREMARQARTDPLTGLLNRRAFLEDVTRRIDRLDREGVPGTLIFVDLDNFKHLNDSHGHEAGDQALIVIGALLRDVVRSVDLVARLGGDEFALWLDGTDELAAAERAEQLCASGPRVIAHLDTPDHPKLGLSVGIATRWPGRGESVDALIHRADQIMYEVKRAGRGHWRVSQTETW